MALLRPALAVAVLALLAAACTSLIPENASAPGPAASPAPASMPNGDCGKTGAKGKTVYRVDPGRSLIAITVRRGGTLARLGHDHIVASHTVQGCIAPQEGRADLVIPLEYLSVDEPALRAEAGLDTQPGESDIAATRINMLDKVLETQRFPFALVRVSVPEKMPAGGRLAVVITLHGVTRTLEVPAQVDVARDGMSVAGSMAFNQSDFGIVPFSILGGAIQVLDKISLRFRIEARRDGTQSGPSMSWPAH
jgi:hypothetical protein